MKLFLCVRAGNFRGSDRTNRKVKRDFTRFHYSSVPIDVINIIDDGIIDTMTINHIKKLEGAVTIFCDFSLSIRVVATIVTLTRFTRI